MSRFPLRARIFLGASVVVLGVYLWLPESVMPFTYDALGLTAFLAMLIGATSLPADRRPPWYLLAAGMAAWVLADFIWDTWALGGTDVPFPSWIDVLYVSAYPLWAIGLLKLSRRGSARDWIVLVDASIVVVSAGLVSWLYLIKPQIDGVHGTLTIVMSAAYPLADILLLGVLVRMILSSRRWERVHYLLVVGLIASLVSDYAFAIAELTNGYSYGVVDLGWLALYALWGTAGLAAVATADEAKRPPRRLSPFVRMVPISVAVLIMPVISWIQAVRQDPENIALSVTAVPLVLLVAVRFGIMLSRTQHVAEELAGKSAALQRALDELHVVQAERARVAVELHDGPIQQLTVLGFRLGKVRSRLRAEDPHRADEALAVVEAELGEGIGNLRRLMSDLRPPALDEGGLAAALRDQVELFRRRTGADITFESDAHGDLDPDTQVVLYRITQEALTNVTRHASAQRVHVRLSTPNRHAALDIADNGVGFDERRAQAFAADGHFGLAGMAQRASMVGGHFEVRSKPGAGTSIHVEVPLKATK